MITEATIGTIQGTVVPAEENVAVYVISGKDITSSTYAVTVSPEFPAAGIQEGHLTVSFDPEKTSDYAGAEPEDVAVSIG